MSTHQYLHTSPYIPWSPKTGKGTKRNARPPPRPRARHDRNRPVIVLDVLAAAVLAALAYGWWRMWTTEPPEETRRRETKSERQLIADTHRMGLAVRRRSTHGNRGWEWQIYDPTDDDPHHT